MFTKLPRAITAAIVCFCFVTGNAQAIQPRFKVIAFFTAKNDQAHISFVHEANKWFPKMAEKYGFTYDSTNDWNSMNDAFLSNYQVVLFLDTRPDSAPQREAFKKYMDNGGGWLGFHFSAFALTPSDFNQDWNWYHEAFLGSGQYGSNTWRPTSAILRMEDKKHPVLKGLPETFKVQPNEWYRWEHDLRINPNIKILLSIDSTSFPLGTGPKQNEIWHSGYYPVVWTNVHYRMVYFNMGHNDIDYEHHTNKDLSLSLGVNAEEDKLIMNALMWVARKK